jgi:hypothetical protein
MAKTVVDTERHDKAGYRHFQIKVGADAHADLSLKLAERIMDMKMARHIMPDMAPKRGKVNFTLPIHRGLGLNPILSLPGSRSQPVHHNE